MKKNIKNQVKNKAIKKSRKNGMKSETSIDFRDEKGRFIKGNPGGGNTCIPKEIKRQIEVCRETFAIDLMEIENYTYQDAIEIDQKIITLRQRIILKAVLDGDHISYMRYHDKVYGKAKENFVIENSKDGDFKISLLGSIDDTTGRVLDILEECGALKSGAE